MKKCYDSTNIEYKKLVAEAPTSVDEHEVTAPTNITKVENFQSAQRKE